MGSLRASRELLLLDQNRMLFSAYALSLNPIGYWRHNETNGTNAANSGTGGSALDMTIAGTTTLGQTGKLGANEAFLTDGATTRLQTPNNALLASLTTWEYVFLCNPASAGEASFGNFFSWGDGAAVDKEPSCNFNATMTSIACSVINTTLTLFTVVTSPTGMTAGVWALLYVAYDDIGDRKIHIYKGINGAVNELASSAALTGTYQTPTKPLNLWNRSAQTTTFAGTVDEAMIFSGNLSSAQRTRLCLLAGV